MIISSSSPSSELSLAQHELPAHPKSITCGRGGGEVSKKMTGSMRTLRWRREEQSLEAACRKCPWCLTHIPSAFTISKHTSQLPTPSLHCDYFLEGSFWLLEPTWSRLKRVRELMILGAAPLPISDRSWWINIPAPSPLGWNNSRILHCLPDLPRKITIQLP